MTDAGPELKPGMSTIVDVVTKKREKVLTLGHEFIHQQGDEYFVMKDEQTKQSIKVGIQNEMKAEVIEGLKEGERIKQIDFLKLSKKR